MHFADKFGRNASLPSYSFNTEPPQEVLPAEAPERKTVQQYQSTLQCAHCFQFFQRKALLKHLNATAKLGKVCEM
jgi:hypothetical protein